MSIKKHGRLVFAGDYKVHRNNEVICGAPPPFNCCSAPEIGLSHSYEPQLPGSIVLVVSLRRVGKKCSSHIDSNKYEDIIHAEFPELVPSFSLAC